jgi:hypothetical protein
MRRVRRQCSTATFVAMIRTVDRRRSFSACLSRLQRSRQPIPGRTTAARAAIVARSSLLSRIIGKLDCLFRSVNHYGTAAVGLVGASMINVPLLGETRVTDRQGREIRFRTVQARRLFIYLACSRDGALPRTALTAAFWAERAAAVSLRQTIDQLRCGLRVQGPAAILQRSDELVGLDRGLLTVDIAVLEAAVQALRGHDQPDLRYSRPCREQLLQPADRCTAVDRRQRRYEHTTGRPPATGGGRGTAVS